MGCVFRGDDEVLDLADDVAFVASDYVPFTEAFGRAAGDVADGGLMESHSDYHGAIYRCVQLPMPTMVDSLPAGRRAGASRDRADAEGVK